MICFLCLSLVYTVRIGQSMERRSFCGVLITTQEALDEEVADKNFVSRADHAQELLLFEGCSIPYDEESNTFYITQDVETEAFEGTLTAAGSGMELYVIASAYTEDKAAAVREGHAFGIYILSETDYTMCNVVFTGLPVLALATQTEEEAENAVVYLDGAVSVWNPSDDEIRTVSDKSSRALIKFSESGGTCTIKLRDDDGLQNRKLALLDMEKQDTWKLYTISEKDPSYLRSMLAYTLWNTINSSQALDRSCRYVEVLINNEYRGLYLLLPRLDEDCGDLPEGTEVQHVESESALEAEDIDFWNLCEYFIFMQTTYAYENIEDYYLVMEPEETYLAPSKLEYSMGIFPNRLEYYSYQAQERILTPEELGVEEAWLRTCLTEEVGDLWRALRQEGLSDEAWLATLTELQETLTYSGFYARSGQSMEDIEAAVESLITYLTVRMEVIDQYYAKQQ